MKKLNYLLLGLAGLAMASCSQDDLIQQGKGEGNYHLTINLPADMATRAYTTGIAADKLWVAVYDADSVFVEKQSFEFGGQLSTEISLNLATGQSYNIALFAQSPASEGSNVYVFDADNKVIKVNYENMSFDGTNADYYDCFYKLQNTGVVGTEVISETVYLTRPIAKVNWGTNDLGMQSVVTAFGDNGAYLTTKFKTQAYNTFDMMESNVTGEMVDVYLPVEGAAEWGVPTGWTFPDVGDPTYQYIAMQYLLAPSGESTTYDLSLTADNSTRPEVSPIQNDLVVTNAPVQANYQTNIYGSLLTDNVNLTVEKDPNWGGAFNLNQDEMVAEGLYYNEDTKTYTIMTPQGLVNYGKIAPATGQGMSAYTIELGADLDMSAISNYVPFNNAGAKFDGNNHTVSNLTVNSTGKASAGFMSSAIGTVKNINFENITVNGGYKVGVLAGDGLCALIENIHVNGATLTSTPFKAAGANVYDEGNNAGGIVGYLSAEGTAYVKNCSVEDVTITAYRKVAAIVGFVNGPAEVTGNTATNSTVYANQFLGTENYTGSSPYPVLAGEICGGYDDVATVQDNTPTNVSVNYIQFESGRNYTINSLYGLQILLQTDNKGALNGKTITIKAENDVIDLNNATIEAIPGWPNVGDYKVNIVGNGVIIKNFTVTGTATGGHFGFIKALGCNLSNLTIDNMTLANTGSTVNSGLFGFYGGTMTNVKVTNSKVTGSTTNAGMLVANDGGVATFTNCIVEGCTIASSYRSGGMVGYVTEGAPLTFNDCQVNSTTVTGNRTYSGIFLGQNVSNSTVTYNECTTSESTVNGIAVTVPGNK